MNWVRSEKSEHTLVEDNRCLLFTVDRAFTFFFLLLFIFHETTKNTRQGLTGEIYSSSFSSSPVGNLTFFRHDHVLSRLLWEFAWWLDAVTSSTGPRGRWLPGGGGTALGTGGERGEADRNNSDLGPALKKPPTPWGDRTSAHTIWKAQSGVRPLRWMLSYSFPGSKGRFHFWPSTEEKLHRSRDIRGDPSRRQGIWGELSGRRTFQQEGTAWLRKGEHRKVRRMVSRGGRRWEGDYVSWK